MSESGGVDSGIKKNENDVLKKLGIVKIQPSLQGSKLRSGTNASIYTERTNNTIISNSGY